MKIRWVEVANFRKFAAPIRVSGIADGVNVLVGHNEMGKSTLLEAINGVVFEKAKSQSQLVRSYRPFAHGTVPQVGLGFDLDGKSWTLRKRFGGQAGKTFLECSDGRRFEDDAAEDELQRLLGFAPGARSAEPGIWGTLWVRQGDSFRDPELDARGRRTLQSCLETQVDAVTGGLRGQRIPDAVERALGEIVNTRGPRGNYKEAVDKLASVQTRLLELEARRSELFERMERLAGLKRELKGLQADWNEEAQKSQLASERKNRGEAVAKTATVEAARAAATLAESRAEQARQAVEERTKLAAEAARLDRALLALGGEFAQAREDQARARDSVAAQEQLLAGLRQEERETGERSRRLERVRGAVGLRDLLGKHEAVLANAASLQAEADRIAQEMGRIAAADADVAAIEAATTNLAAARAALDAVATNLSLALEAGAEGKVTIDGAPLAGLAASIAVVARAEIVIAAVGRIVVEPQIRGRDAMVERLAKAEDALKSALDKAGVADLASARREAARRGEFERQLAALQKELGRLAPGDRASRLAPGLDALRLGVSALRGRLAAETKALDLAVLPSAGEIDVQIASAHENAARLAAEIAAADAALAPPRTRFAEADKKAQGLQQKLAVAQNERATVEARLQAGRAETDDSALARQAAELAQQAAAQRRIAAELEREPGESLAAIDARIRRMEAAERNYADAVTRLNTDITRFSTWIEANEGAGIEEELEDSKTELARLETRVKEYDQEARTLKLLLDTLRAAEREAKERYLAPVVTRVQPYLSMLLPETAIVLDEDFRISAVVRKGVEENFDRLSAGTQEQIAILTRLAFAELLLDEGRPAAVILDDALVFSDDDRIERMFDIMARAAEKTQIIVLTCHRRLFTRLGATVLNIEGEEAA